MAFLGRASMASNVLLVTALMALHFNGANCSPDERRLIDHLLTGYNTLELPVAQPSQTLPLDMGLQLLQILELDEVKKTITLQAWLNMRWNDANLRWNESEFGGIKHLYLPAERLWTMDLTLYNSLSQPFNPTNPTKAYVSSNGDVIYVPPAQYTASCDVDEMTSFPYDLQKCQLKFGSWVYSGLQVNLSNIDSSASTDYYVKNSEFDLVGAPAFRTVKHYGDLPDPYISIEYKLILQRHPSYYLVRAFVPTLVLGLLSLLGFLLPARSGEKILLQMAILLCLGGVASLITWAKPSILAHYVCRVILLVVIAVGLNILIICTAHRTTSMRPLMRKIFVETLPVLFGMGNLNVQDEKNGEEWQFASRVLDRLAMAAGFVYLFAVTLCFLN